MNGNLFPKQEINLTVYRGDDIQLIFSNLPDLDVGIVTVKFQCRKTPDSELLIDQDVISTDEANDWPNGIVGVNLIPGQTQLIPPDDLYQYDLRITRDGIVNADVYGTIFIKGDISGTGTIVTPITEASIYANFASDQPNKGASLIGVLASFWDSAIGAANDTVEEVLQWLYTNGAKVVGTFTDNKILRSDGTTGTMQTSIVTLDDLGNITGAGSVSSTSIISSGDITGTTGTFSDHVSVASGKEFRRTGSEYVDTIIKTILTTSGDLLIKSGSAIARLGIGSAGYVLGITTGLPAWIDLSAAIQTYFLTILTANGDLLTRSSGVLARIAAGTNGYVLTIVAGAPAWADLSTAGFLPLTGGTMTGDIVDLSVPDGSASAPSVKVGGEENGLYSGAANLLGFTTGGSGRMTVDGNGQFQAVINSTVGTDYPTTLSDIYFARTWCVFSVSAGTPSIDGSGNVSSITDSGEGQFVLNYATNLPDGNYSATIGWLSDVTDYTAFANCRMAQVTNRATSSCSITSGNVGVGGGFNDFANYSVVVFR